MDRLRDVVNAGTNHTADVIYHSLAWVLGEEHIAPYAEFVADS